MRDEIRRALGAFMELELKTLLDAVSQYVENSEEVEGELSEHEQAKLSAARDIRDGLAEKVCAAADYRNPVKLQAERKPRNSVERP